MSQPNRVAIALSSIFAGAGTGGAIASCFVWAAWQQWSFLNVLGDLSNTVFLGWAIGGATAFVVSWRLSPALPETWRRAAMGVTAALGALGAGGGAQGVGMASMMTMSWTSVLYLPVYTTAFIVIAVAAFRVARKHRSPPTA